MKNMLMKNSFADRKKVNILVADDKEGIRNILSEIIENVLKDLNHKEYNIDMAYDGYTAIQKVKKTFFNITFLDINMDKLNGVKTLKQIKKISPKTVVIMMTGGARDNLLKEAIEENAYIILYKPFNSKVIADVMKEVLPANSSYYLTYQKSVEAHNL